MGKIAFSQKWEKPEMSSHINRLVSASYSGIQRLLDITSQYPSNWNIKFNAKKSVVMHTGNKLYANFQLKLKLGCEVLDVVSKFKYLSIEFSDNLKFDSHIEKKIQGGAKKLFCALQLWHKTARSPRLIYITLIASQRSIWYWFLNL